MGKEDRGFASMTRERQREIASKGGVAAHQKGTAHEWTSDEARDAGRKGGRASAERRRKQAEAGAVVDDVASGGGGYVGGETPQTAEGASGGEGKKYEGFPLIWID